MNSLEKISQIGANLLKKLESVPDVLPSFRGRILPLLGAVLLTSCDINIKIEPPREVEKPTVASSVPPTVQSTVEVKPEEKPASDDINDKAEIDAEDTYSPEVEPEEEPEIEKPQNRSWAELKPAMTEGYKKAYLRYWKAGFEERVRQGQFTELPQRYQDVEKITETEALFCIRTSYIRNGQEGGYFVEGEGPVDASGNWPNDDLHDDVVIESDGSKRFEMFVAVSNPYGESSRVEFRWDYGENSTRLPKVSSYSTSASSYYRLVHPYSIKANETGTHTFTVTWLDAPGGRKEICRKEIEVIANE